MKDHGESKIYKVKSLYYFQISLKGDVNYCLVPIFYEQLLRKSTLRLQKILRFCLRSFVNPHPYPKSETDDLTAFLHFWDLHAFFVQKFVQRQYLTRKKVFFVQKNARKTLMKLTICLGNKNMI